MLSVRRTRGAPVRGSRSGTPGSPGGRGRRRWRRGGAARGCAGRRGQPASPLPASGPSHSHAGPRPLGLLPPRGHQSPGEEDGAHNFLLPAARPGSAPRAASPAANTKGKTSPFAPHAPRQIPRGRGARAPGAGGGRGETLAVSGKKRALLRPLASTSRYCSFSELELLFFAQPRRPQSLFLVCTYYPLILWQALLSAALLRNCSNNSTVT